MGKRAFDGIDFETLIGLAAAFFTTTSYAPQVMKAWKTGTAEDLSLKMLFALGTGLALWIFYGVLRGDFVIIVANVVSLALVGFLVAFKNWTEYRPARR